MYMYIYRVPYQGKMKGKKNNWFEKCTGEELKQLCQATKLPVSGTKDVLITRLLDCNQSKPFGYEPKRMTMHSFDRDDICIGSEDEEEGPLSVNAIKSISTRIGLSSTGKRFDIVLRILQEKNGFGNPKKRKTYFEDEEIEG